LTDLTQVTSKENEGRLGLTPSRTKSQIQIFRKLIYYIGIFFYT